MHKSLYPAVIFILALLLPAAGGVLHAQDLSIGPEPENPPPDISEILKWKEVLTYEVRYSFFKLGEVRTEVVRDTLHDGRRVWWLRSIIRSNSSIPFVGKEENHYNSFIVADDSMPYTELYWRDNVDEQEFSDSRYDFDYGAGKVYVTEKGEEPDTLELDEPASSGQLILLYSRLFAGSERSYRLPVYLEREKGEILADNSRHTSMREYEAFEEPVPVFHSEGNADVDGPFGFRGEFEAWFRDDPLRVPVEAHMKVWLGNVKVRLIDYQKVKRP
ncbi:MAG: DUF3108 domain-containing protein [Balneolaceae bacterium]|nr:DUF3108 domain-containing protein [Balneolaceae bacterium]